MNELKELKEKIISALNQYYDEKDKYGDDYAAENIVSFLEGICDYEGE